MTSSRWGSWRTASGSWVSQYLEGARDGRWVKRGSVRGLRLRNSTCGEAKGISMSMISGVRIRGVIQRSWGWVLKIGQGSLETTG